MNRDQVDDLASFVVARINEQSERCHQALADPAVSLPAKMALTIALASCEAERVVVARWKSAEAAASNGDREAGRVAAALHLIVMMIARSYRFHADYDAAWA